MRIPHALLPIIRTVTVLAFAALCAGIFGYLWVNAGGKIPLFSRAGYQVAVVLPDVDNLVFQSDVRMAGVDVGKVEDVEVTGSRVRVTLDVEPQQVPLHRGTKVFVRNKTMVEETYLEVVDGKGPEIPSGATLPESAGHPSVQLDDVLTSLDERTRDSLGTALRSAGRATRGTRDEVGATLEGLGEIGRQGGDALVALAGQSKDLSTVAANTTALLEALDTRQGRVAQLVSDSNALTKTVAANRAGVERLMRTFPRVLKTTRVAGGELDRLGRSLAPVAANLRAAAPHLTAALRELPATAADLRGMLPSLESTLDRAPRTLDRVPGFARAARPLMRTLNVDLADVNPMLGYLRPYGKDIAAFFANFGQYLSGSDANGNVSRVLPVFNEKSLNSPLNSQVGPLDRRNPYPRPGSSDNPGPYVGKYPHIEEEPQPR
jgi:phospholipid/cholesterol/gamma-HCH transport system substrate-binding protein